MPIVVDPDERRKDLAEAVWRVVRRDGLERASVREVAREAGVSMGSLRHYFGSQSELLIFAMRMVIERIEERVASLPLSEDPRQDAERVLSELLPLDHQRQMENEVWLAFTARSLVDPALRALRDEAYDALRAACRRWISRLLPPGRSELEVETDRLFALLDGLAVHAAMRPVEASPERLLAVLNYHLDGVTAA
ncbi:TetR/AcrR family transcriptional regulator [Kocuria rosea]|uniref:TetR/AcrR family transcriptional regulator n=1 Tax=Kocuria rosea TaxID=1275 RepID=UPI000D604884|nr:TetR family transcriptional regulator C-terminal domain-containing protein [Kocuria rosea]PWD94604.1 TetR family transcriptional regulator [Dietzia maris]PWF79552.1 TetR family transcriptional regulator [Kocuria rosea]STX07016.1 transcriptional regulator BetI [Kocuria rosea]